MQPKTALREISTGYVQGVVGVPSVRGMNNPFISITWYPTQFTDATDGTKETLRWSEFVERLREPAVVNRKGAEPQYFPGTLIADAKTKGDASVDSVSLYALDCDGVTEEQYKSLISKIRTEHLAAVLHTTHSHAAQRATDGRYRVRVVFLLSEPVNREMWKTFWRCARLDFGEIADPTTSSPSKHYLVPSHPPTDEAAKAHIFREFRGAHIDVQKMLQRYSTAALAESEIKQEQGR